MSGNGDTGCCWRKNGSRRGGKCDSTQLDDSTREAIEIGEERDADAAPLVRGRE